MEKIAGVVVLYNPDDKWQNNVLSYIDELDFLVIVDNSSFEHKYDILIKKSHTKIEYVSKKDNIGIATALNIGCFEAIKKGCKWILTMDQDSYFKNDNFKKYIKNIETSDMNKIGVISPWHKTKLKQVKPSTRYDYPTDVMTSGNLLNLNIFDKIGKFKDEFFIDGVDIEYGFRLYRYDYLIKRDNSIELIHGYGDCKYVKKFGRTYTCTNHNYLRRYYIVRNYYYINDMYKDILPEKCKQLITQRHYIMSILMCEKDKYRKIRNSLRGYLDYKKGIKGKYRFKN